MKLATFGDFPDLFWRLAAPNTWQPCSLIQLCVGQRRAEKSCKSRNCIAVKMKFYSSKKENHLNKYLMIDVKRYLNHSSHLSNRYYPVRQMCRSKSCVPVRCAGTSYASASARDSILSAQRAGAH